MGESSYRVGKLLLLTIFVAGSLSLGWRFVLIGEQVAQNGRYVQFDRQRDTLILGSTAQSGPTLVIDTRTGTLRPANKE